MTNSSNPAALPEYKKIMQSASAYRQPNRRAAIWQIVNSLLPYAALWGLMIYFMKNGYSYWFTLGAALLAAGFLVRIFIIFHDCCHGSFFKSRKANRFWGFVAGTLTFTAFQNWRRAHLVHHATSGDLDHRGLGDIWMLTVEEYFSASWPQRLAYRLYRNPFIMFGIGPAFKFFINQRYYTRDSRPKEKRNIIGTNIAIAAILLSAVVTIGLKTYLFIQLPVMLIAGTAGVWLFYIQHQYEGVYWERHAEWDPVKSALEGSSYYKLPKILQWFSGNIGLHHIHHIEPRIPNYNLQRCYNGSPLFQSVNPLTILQSLKSLRMKLWDEENHRLVNFRSLRLQSGG